MELGRDFGESELEVGLLLRGYSIGDVFKSGDYWSLRFGVMRYQEFKAKFEMFQHGVTIGELVDSSLVT